MWVRVLKRYRTFKVCGEKAIGVSLMIKSNVLLRKTTGNSSVAQISATLGKKYCPNVTNLPFKSLLPIDDSLLFANNFSTLIIGWKVIKTPRDCLPLQNIIMCTIIPVFVFLSSSEFIPFWWRFGASTEILILSSGETSACREIFDLIEPNCKKIVQKTICREKDDN